MASAAREEEFRINGRIEAHEVRLIGAEGEMIGVVSTRSSESESVSSPAAIGHSMPVEETSPSAWRAWPSPAEKSAPGMAIGR